MESTGSTFPKWQLAILIGTPVALGLGYLYWKNQNQSIEEGTDDDKTELKKKLTGDTKSISIDGDTAKSASSNANSPTTNASNGIPKEFESKQFKKLSPFEKAVKYKESGNDCFKNGKYDGAIELYDKAIEICPKSNSIDLSQFYQNRAAAYEQLKKWSNVSDDCTKALELNPKYVKALHRRARAFWQEHAL